MRHLASLQWNEGIDAYVSPEERIRDRLFSKIPPEIMPATTLFRWGQAQQPKVQHYVAMGLWLDDRIPAAFEHGHKVYVKLDTQVVDERGPLAAVRSVIVLPAK